MLKRLEVQLGTRLFERSTRAMRLTAQGQTLLDYTSRAFELLAEGESQVTQAGASLVGAVRVAAPSDLTRTTLLPWFSEFMAAHPGLNLTLTMGDKPRDLLRDEVDIALRYGVLPERQTEAYPLHALLPSGRFVPQRVRALVDFLALKFAAAD
jgi:DNA-binding transcriptional LysR family regulator